ncbi:MAG: 1,4-dihydroxy-2-naphthoyl-CoA hydrolase [Cyclobacteriaceae bacterium]|jgi:1,4-dihydroxy-2-naphthoyl-CoA hydrolase
MFPEQIDIEQLNKFSENTMVSHLGIEFTEVNSDSLKARMPVDERTKQPMGILHGGASVVLAETLGSVASSLLLNREKQYAVGLEINANHVKSAKEGFVWGTTKAIHIGKRTHIWEIVIKNDAAQLVAISRLTVAIIDRK